MACVPKPVPGPMQLNLVLYPSSCPSSWIRSSTPRAPTAPPRLCIRSVLLALCSATLSFGVLTVLSPFVPSAIAQGAAAGTLLVWYKANNCIFPPAAVLAGALTTVSLQTVARNSVAPLPLEELQQLAAVFGARTRQLRAVVAALLELTHADPNVQASGTNEMPLHLAAAETKLRRRTDETGWQTNDDNQTLMTFVTRSWHSGG